MDNDLPCTGRFFIVVLSITVVISKPPLPYQLQSLSLIMYLLVFIKLTAFLATVLELHSQRTMSHVHLITALSEIIGV